MEDVYNRFRGVPSKDINRNAALLASGQKANRHSHPEKVEKDMRLPLHTPDLFG